MTAPRGLQALIDTLRSTMTQKGPEAEMWLNVILTIPEDLRLGRAVRESKRALMPENLDILCGYVGLEPEYTKRVILEHVAEFKATEGEA